MFNNGVSLADIAAVTGNNRNNDGMWGDGAWWIVILLIFGWGNGGFGGWGNGGNNGVGAEIQRGFDTQSIVGKLDGITNGLCDGFYAQNTAIMNGFHGVDNAICNLGYQTQQGFNTTNVALMQGQNALQTQLANCCCENREGQAQIRYDMATNTCALQNTMNNNTRDIIENQNAGTRAVLDYLCAKENADLRDKVQKLELAASQSAQNAYIAANQEAQTAELIRRINPTPVPAYPAASPCGLGNWSPNVLANGYYNNGCGCNTGCGC